MEFVSIGPYCKTAEILIANNLRQNAYPFDYIFSSLEIVHHCIKDKFKIFLDKKYYSRGNCKYSTRHNFYCKYLDTDILLKHHINDNYNSDYQVSNGNLFNHHNLLKNASHYEAFKRRANRLLNLIDNDENVVFVYYNCYTNTFDDVIHFSKSFNDKKNIYIIGIFENNGNQKILYESDNCKIYQNYTHTDIFDEIKYIFNRDDEIKMAQDHLALF